MRRRALLAIAAAMTILTAACSAILGIGDLPEQSVGVDGSVEDGATADGQITDGGGDGCIGLRCSVAMCASGSDTTVSGTLYAPNGSLPIYNAIVFVPSNPTLPAQDAGVVCNRCGPIAEDTISKTLTDGTGHFTLHGVPTGSNIPLVFQLGKWRREVTISTTSCIDNPITDPDVSRLPKSHLEGDLPYVAITTGACDPLPCMFPKLGIDPSEFGVRSDYPNKHVIFYQGQGGPSTKADGGTTAQSLYTNLAELEQYDLTVLSCQCNEDLGDKPSPQSQQNMYDYLSAGGRTLASDFMYTWLHDGPGSLPLIMQGFTGGAPPSDAGIYSVDETYPKGSALNIWLRTAGASPANDKALLAPNVFKNFSTVNPTFGQRWVYGDSDKMISFTAPLEASPDERCGRSYFLDMHANTTTAEVVDTTFPAGCNGSALNGSEDVVAFALMDLFGCVQDDTLAPIAP